MTEKILANDRICSRHFLSGKPAALEDDTNPDWLPSLNLGHSKISENQVRIGEKRWIRRKAREDGSYVNRGLKLNSQQPDDNVFEVTDCPCTSEASVQTTVCSTSETSIQTDLSFIMVSLVPNGATDTFTAGIYYIYVDWKDAE